MPEGNSVPSDPRYPPPPEGESLIAVFRTARQAHEAGLAILACGHSYRAWPVENGYAISVDSKRAALLQQEVLAAHQRNRLWPPPSRELPLLPAKTGPLVAWTAGLAGLFACQQFFPNLATIGANSAEATLANHEWWRVVTALTLHANIGHLAGNLAGLFLFLYFATQYLRSGLALLLALLASALANLTSDLANAGHAYQSLGASTMVFAALGVLTGYPAGYFLRTRHSVPARDWFMPFAGGFVLFATMGGGDYPTDVGAHLFGFIWGGVVGLLAARFAWAEKQGTTKEKLWLAVAFAIPVAAWAWALSSLAVSNASP